MILNENVGFATRIVDTGLNGSVNPAQYLDKFQKFVVMATLICFHLSRFEDRELQSGLYRWYDIPPADGGASGQVCQTVSHVPTIYYTEV